MVKKGPRLKPGILAYSFFAAASAFGTGRFFSGDTSSRLIVRITGNSSGNGPEMFQEDGTLYITQESGMSIPLFGDGTNAENIRIEIPEDLVLEKLWIHNGLGNTVVQ